MTKRSILILAIASSVALCASISPALAGVSTTGNVTPDPSTTTSADELFVGKTADGSMTIDLGSGVIDKDGYLGFASGSTGTATVTGTGSAWISREKLVVGYLGTSTLNIENGGTMASGWCHIAIKPGSTGTATITGPGSTWTNSGELYVGQLGTGTLNIENGGAVTVDNDLYINSQSTLNILLASLTDPLLDVGGNATLDGALSVGLADGFALNQGDLFTLIDVGNILTGTFTGLAEGDTVGNFGGRDLLISYAGGDGNDVSLYTILDLDIDIKPGSDQNPLNLNSNGVLPVAIFGETDFDVYNIDLSSLSLEGALPKQSGNSPKVGSYKDINGDNLTDLLLHFDLAELDVDGSPTELVLQGELNNGMAFNVSDSIRIVGPGDVNADGLVDGSDLSTIISNWGQSVPSGDLDGNGIVDGGDYSEVLSYWGTGTPASPPSDVPEPATLLVLCVGGTILFRRRS